MKPKNIIACVLGVFLCFPVGFAATMSHEETVVRRAYSKLAYAVQLKTLLDTARTTTNPAEVAEAVRKNELHFTLTDFKAGPLSEIAQVNYDDLVTKPNGDSSLAVSVHTEQVNEGGQIVSSNLANTPKWTKEQIVHEDWKVPIGKALPIIEQQNDGIRLLRYATYTVTVEFDGRYRTYKAMFLFGKDKNGDEAMVPLDVVNINGSSLDFFAQHPVGEDVLLRTKMRTLPAVQTWMSGHAIKGCSLKSKDTCCDAASLMCGPGGAQ